MTKSGLSWLDRKKAELTQKRGDPRLWKPQEGKNKIRILPYKYNKETPFTEVYFIFNISRDQLVSPLTHGKSCPVKKFADKFLNSRDTEDYKIGKSIEPKLYYVVPIVLRGAEDSGIKLWKMSESTFNSLLELIDEMDVGEIWDPADGHDLTVVYEKAKSKNSFNKTSVIIQPKSTPATTSDKQLKGWLESVPNILELYPAASATELRDKLEAFIGGDPEDDELEDEIPTKKGKATKKPVVEDVDEEDEEEDDEVEEEIDEEEEEEDDEESDDADDEEEEEEDDEPVIATKSKMAARKGSSLKTPTSDKNSALKSDISKYFKKK